MVSERNGIYASHVAVCMIGRLTVYDESVRRRRFSVLGGLHAVLRRASKISNLEAAAGLRERTKKARGYFANGDCGPNPRPSANIAFLRLHHHHLTLPFVSMASSGYERIPTSDVDAPGSQSASLRHRSQSRSRASSPPAAPPASLDARFERPVPAAWKRVALLLFVALLFYLSFALGKLSHPTRQPLPKVVHASRCVSSSALP